MNSAQSGLLQSPAPPMLASDAYVEATRFIVLVGESEHRAWSMAHHLRLVKPYFALLRSLPLVELTPTTSPSGRRLAAMFGRDSWRKAGGHAVLALDTHAPEAYLQGRSRQAVRTALTKATRSGITCRPLEPAERSEALAAFAATKHDPTELKVWTSEVHVSGARWWVAEDTEASVIGIAYVLVDVPQAVLQLLTGPDDRDKASPVRYLLHTTAAVELAREGVTWLVLRDAIFASSGLQWFAARLGYRPARVRVLRAPGLLPGLAGWWQTGRQSRNLEEQP